MNRICYVIRFIIFKFFFKVYDGNSSSARQLGKFCGDQIPQPIHSSGDSVYVKLRTDNSLQGGGFLAKYKQGK